LARAEGWTPEHYNDTMSRTRNGPMSDLPGKVEYFNATLIECRAEAEARVLLAARKCRLEGCDDRRSWHGNENERGERAAKAQSECPGTIGRAVPVHHRINMCCE
jgi:hypothetical protein